MQEFKYTGMGGSFDHYHVGHKVMLTTAALLTGESLHIGVTSDEMISKKDAKEILQPFSLRYQLVEQFLRDIGYTKGLDIAILNGVAGRAATSTELTALIITEETLKGGNFVNETREKNGLSPVKLIFAEIISSRDKSNLADKVSSSAIRKELKSQMEHITNCFNNWNHLCNLIQLPEAKALYWFSILRDLYLQSWRKYHSLNHIDTYTSQVINAYKESKVKDVINLLLAVWFHDSIYVASRGDNEDRSVELFEDFYKDIENEKDVRLELIDRKKVGYYIMCTKYHFDAQRNYDDLELNYFLDFDVYTFSFEDEKAFFEVSHNIRQEYFLYNDKEWASGRVKFLTSLSTKDFIYRTEDYRSRFEKTAKSNIEKEINYYRQQI